MDYLDFELEIQPGTGREYPVTVLRSPAGEADATMHFPFDQIALESRLDKLQIALLRSGGKLRSVLSDEEKAVQEFGQALFEAAFTGEVRNRYDVSCERAAQKEQGLRLKLRIQAPELAALPWEYLYDAGRAEYVCLSTHTPLVRYLKLPQSVQALRVTPPLRILGLIVSPGDQEPLDVEQEKGRVEQAVADLRDKGLVELTWLDGQTWRDLQRAMRSGPWHIFHFVGHGGYDSNRHEGLVVLAGEDGRSEYMPATQLARLLADHQSLRLVVLNACEGGRGSKRDVFSSTASILVRRNIPAVIAMQYEITDQAAIEFGRALYEALADGLPVDAAVAEARKAVSLKVVSTLEWGTPVLYMRTPDGVLFDMSASLLTSGSHPALEAQPVEAVPVEPPPASVQVTPATTATPPVSDSTTPELASVSQPLARPQPARRSGRPWAAIVGMIGLLAVSIYILVWLIGGGGKPTLPPLAAQATPSHDFIPCWDRGLAAPTEVVTKTWENDMVLVKVPEGWFVFGSCDLSSYDYEDRPWAQYQDGDLAQDEEKLQEFWISQTEVTNAQYSRCVQEGRCSSHLVPYLDSPELAERPVVNVDWDQATAYAEWVGGLLPTEKEWEKACRGTDARIYPWGDERPQEAWLNYGSARSSAIDVGSFPRFSYGLLDMAGNVWEWTSTPYENSLFHVLRGGAFNSDARSVRCASRRPGSSQDIVNRTDNIGFRVVVASPINAPSSAPAAIPIATLMATASSLPQPAVHIVPLATSTSISVTVRAQAQAKDWWIAYSFYCSEEWEVYAFKASGASLTKLTNNSVVDGDPAISPDGTQVAFQSERDGDREIYTMNVDGTGIRRLTFSAGWDGTPAWSADGNLIAFTSWRTQPMSVYVMNIDGTNSRQLTSSPFGDWMPSWAPDGEQVAFASWISDGISELFTVNSDGSNRVQLTRLGAKTFGPRWSPDGNRIAFYSDASGSDHVYVMNRDGTGIAKLENNGPVMWSPDGQEIVYSAGPEDIYIMNGDGANIRPVVTGVCKY